MNKEIEKLRELSFEYYQLGLKIGVINHYYFENEPHEAPISIYIAQDDKSYWNCRFYGIKISNEGKLIEMPTNITTEKLRYIYQKASEFLKFIEIEKIHAVQYAKLKEDKLELINRIKAIDLALKEERKIMNRGEIKC